MVIPRYLTELEHGTGVELIEMVAVGLSRCLEITKRVLFWGLIASPEDDIQATILSTSDCS